MGDWVAIAPGSEPALVRAILRAIDPDSGSVRYNSRDGWRELQVTGMAQDFSWLPSAERYLELYQEALNLER